MPFTRTRSQLVLAPVARDQLLALCRARTASVAEVERAQVMLAYADGETVSAIARRMGTNRPKVERRQ